MLCLQQEEKTGCFKMGKFVKVSQVPGPPTNPVISTAAKLYLSNQQFREKLVKRFPKILTLLGNQTGPNLFAKIAEALQDEEVLKFLIADLLPSFGLGIDPSKAYSPEAFKYYLDTKGAGGESIASGDYQFQLEKMPSPTQLPPSNLDAFIRDVRKLNTDYGSDPRNLKKKQEALTQLMARYQSQLGGFEKYLMSSFPGLK
jgi:hypothetical protein